MTKDYAARLLSCLTPKHSGRELLAVSGVLAHMQCHLATVAIWWSLKMGDPQNPWVSTCFNTKMV